MNDRMQNRSNIGRLIFISLLFVFSIGLSTHTSNDFSPNHHVVSSFSFDKTNKLATIQAIHFAFLNPSCIILINKLLPFTNLSYLRVKETNRLNELNFRVQKITLLEIHSLNEFQFFYRKIPSRSDEIPILG